MARWFAVWCFLAPAALAVAPREPLPPSYHLGKQFLAQGRLSEAEAAFRRGIEEEPLFSASRFELGITLARQRRCQEARGEFDSLREWPWFNMEGFLAEAQCAERDGQAEEALDRFEMAVERRPFNTKALFHLVRILQELGYDERAVPYLDRLRERELKGSYTPLAMAHGALGTPAFDTALEELRRHASGSTDIEAKAEFAMLKGRADLLDDNPCRAVKSMFPALKTFLGHMDYASWRAEAFRRCGDLDRAQRAVTRERIAKKKPRPWLLAVSARIAIDRGDLRAARAFLDQYPLRADADFVATAWYLARAEGQALDSLEAKYAVVRRRQDGDLLSLVPLEFR